MESWSNQEVISLIRGTGDHRKQFVRYMIQNQSFFDKVKSYVQNNNGDLDDARMLYHDMLVAFVKQVFEKKDLTFSSHYKAYLFQMVKNRWISELRKRNNKVVSIDVPEYREDVDDEALADVKLWKGQRAELLRKVLEQMRARCKEVLMYWAGGYKMKEIANLLNYQSEGMVRKKKSDCMKALYAYLADNPDIVEQLKGR